MIQSERVNRGASDRGRDRYRRYPYGLEHIGRPYPDDHRTVDDVRAELLGYVPAYPRATVYSGRICYIGLPAVRHQGEAP